MTTDEEIELKTEVRQLREIVDHERAERLALTKTALAEMNSERAELRQQVKDACVLSGQIALQSNMLLDNVNKLTAALDKLRESVQEILKDYTSFKCSTIQHVTALLAAAGAKAPEGWKN